MKNNTLLLTAICASLLSACQTLDAINPFDKTDKELREEQGEVAGDDQRISILELSETLKVADASTTAPVILPDAYVNIDCLLYTSPSPRDATLSRMPSSA